MARPKQHISLAPGAMPPVLGYSSVNIVSDGEHHCGDVLLFDLPLPLHITR
jgi:hypothetical protein